MTDARDFTPPSRSNVSPDGMRWTKAQNEEINRIVARALEDEAGQELLTYLRNVTLNRPLSPNATDAELRHMEGQRWLVAMLIDRLNTHKKEK